MIVERRGLRHAFIETTGQRSDSRYIAWTKAINFVRILTKMSMDPAVVECFWVEGFFSFHPGKQMVIKKFYALKYAIENIG